MSPKSLVCALILATSLAATVPVAVAAPATTKAEPTRKIIFKSMGDVNLALHVFEPKGHKDSDARPAIVFFFGGGWNGGSPSQFYPHCAHLASKGMVAISAEYRVKSRHKTSPYNCVEDGNSAIRFVRANAKKLGINPKMVAAGGGSAGGHVAAATATTTAFETKGEDTAISSIPDALVLFNPVYDNGPKGYGHSRVADRWKEFSPMHNIRKGMAPTIVFLGTNDKLIPVATGEAFRDKMKAVGAYSELHLYKDRTHGFFNENKGGGEDYADTLVKMDAFLQKLGYVK